ncbi:Nucleic-acid-binding protein from transposon X-element [Eumeta japonica]|uniref:Nucleic-acid-binding protein from transposon X-element n=1 Tax=Eumeta variegata TaxID=151549 RepID=A0A4C1WPM7_EUMVA|nr:Nucleic-acid-binding protein from transposon X-element [Eumeta japonica]
MERARGSPQCHRCQAFGHSSANCHSPQRCIRCGEGHIAADYPRPRDQGPTCANCKNQHPASDRRCPVFRREARQRGNIIPLPPPSTQFNPPEYRQQHQGRIGRTGGCSDVTAALTTTSAPSKSIAVSRGGAYYGEKMKKKAEEKAEPFPESSTISSHLRNSDGVPSDAPEIVPTQGPRSAMASTPMALRRAVPQREMSPAVLTSTRPPILTLMT